MATSTLELLLKEKGLDRQAAQVVVREAIDRIEGRRPWDLNEFGWLNQNTLYGDGHVYKPNSAAPIDMLPLPDDWGQAGFHNSVARLRAAVGGRGSGKTATGIQEALRLVQERPGWPGGIVSPNVPHWNRSTWPEIERWTPWDRVVQHHQTQKWIEFDNGTKVYYGGIDDPDSWRGPNLNWLWFDEAARKRTDRDWLILLATVRVGPDPRAFVTTTPRGMRHWVKSFFADKKLPAEARAWLESAGLMEDGQLIEWFWLDLQENLDNLDPLFYATLLTAYTGAFKDQEVGGLFVEEGGTLGNRDWFAIVPSAPADAKRVRFWDLAATEKKAMAEDPDYTVGAKVAFHEGLYFIEHITRGQIDAHGIENEMTTITYADGIGVKVGVEQEPAAAGKILVAHYQDLLRGFVCEGLRSTGDKVTRAMAWLGQAKAGNVKLVAGHWNEEFLIEVDNFPVGNHDDQIDAVSGAVALLGGIGPPAASEELEIDPEVYQAEVVRTKWL